MTNRRQEQFGAEIAANCEDEHSQPVIDAASCARHGMRLRKTGFFTASLASSGTP
jgi:hypothetical protein